MFKVLKNNKEIVLEFYAVNDFATKYAGSLFGTFWAFVQPATTILIYACVFQYGLESTSPVAGCIVVHFLVCSRNDTMVFPLRTVFRAVTNVLIEYSYLVKKVVFDVRLLPVIKILSAFFVHLVFIVLLFLIAFVNKESLSMYVLQVIYYLVCAILLIYAIGKFTSSIILFFRDLGQIVNIVLDMVMWATPIIWS